MTSVARSLLLVLAVIFVLGVLIGIFELGFSTVLGYRLPSWSAAQYLGAAFLIGLVYFVGEIIWHPIGRVLVDADKATDPLWKRLLRALILVVIGMLPIVVYMVWQLN